MNKLYLIENVWIGLNDKEQLGGPKGSKIKLPVAVESMAALQPVSIVGGSKSLFVVSQSGKVLFCCCYRGYAVEAFRLRQLNFEVDRNSRLLVLINWTGPQLKLAAVASGLD